MKLNPKLGVVPLVVVAVIGIALFLFFSGGLSATGVDIRQIGQNFGWNSANECEDIALYYMDGSTTIALTIDETRQTNYDFIICMYETASDVWRYPTADVTLKDSDSDGYIDWIGFTATGGNTAGGEVRIRGIASEYRIPAI